MSRFMCDRDQTVKVSSFDVESKHYVDSIIDSLKCSSHEPQQQFQACDCVLEIYKDEIKQDAFITAGGVDALATCMSNYMSNAGVQKAIYTVFRAFQFADQAYQSKLVAAIEPIIKGMQLHTNNLDVQFGGIGTLTMIANDHTPNELKIFQLGGIDVIVKAMNQFKDVEKIQVLGMIFLHMVFNDEDMEKRILKKRNPKLITALIDVMERHSGIDDICWQACDMLAKTGFPVTVKHVKIIIAAMNKHLLTVLVQICALELFCPLVHKYAKIMVSAGLIDIVIERMNSNLEVEPLHDAALSLLSRLVSFSPIEDQEKNQGTIVNAGGIETILKSMQNFPQSIVIQEEGISALLTTATFNPLCQLKTFELGAVDVIVKAMQQFVDESKLQTLACRLLHVLVDNEDVGAKMADDCKPETVIAIINAMNHYTDTNELIAYACEVLVQIGPSNAIEIGNAGGIETIVTCMKRYKAQMDLLQATCDVLSSLAGDVSNQTKIANSDVIHFIIECMRHYSEDGPFQVIAIDTLINLSEKSVPIRLKIGESGGVDIILQAMQNFCDDERLQESGNLALDKLGETLDRTKIDQFRDSM